jgi:hypothetical protein
MPTTWPYENPGIIWKIIRANAGAMSTTTTSSTSNSRKLLSMQYAQLSRTNKIDFNKLIGDNGKTRTKQAEHLATKIIMTNMNRFNF